MLGLCAFVSLKLLQGTSFDGCAYLQEVDEGLDDSAQYNDSS